MINFQKDSQDKKHADAAASFPQKAISGYSIPEMHLLSHPFRVNFISYRPDNEEDAYIFTSVVPENRQFFTVSRNAFRTNIKPLLHRTNFYELYFIIEGSMFQNIEHQRHLYPQGSCVLLNPNVRRVLEYGGAFRYVSVQLSNDFIVDLFQNMPYFQAEQNEILLSVRRFFRHDMNPENSAARNYIDFIPLKDPAWIRQNIHPLFERIVKESLEPHAGSSHMVRALFTELFYKLFHPDNFSDTPVSLGNSGEKELFEEITKYIKQRNGRVSRRELAEVFHYSGNYIYKVVHKYTGLSVFDYGMTFCLKEAARMLSETTLTAQEISNTLGFSNRSHFYRLFRDMYKMTPKEYRRHGRE